jgi:regulator of RNase E activity RraA
LHIGLPVHVGGLTVNTGDLLHGDRNGVTRVPLEIASEIPDAAKEFVAAERIMLDYVQGAGPFNVQEFADRRKAFTAEVNQLCARLKR